eukprot:1548809-Amphidinium_carterae.2
MSLLEYSTRVDACAYGFEYKGRPCKKPWMLKSSMPLVRLERLCACNVPQIPCEGGGHVAKSARYTESMAKAAVRSLMKGLKISVSARASETDDDEDGAEPEVITMDDDEDDVLEEGDEPDMKDVFGSDDEDEDEEIETPNVPNTLPDLDTHVESPLNPVSQVEHEERGHYPKSPLCPICPLSDGPTHQHKRLRKREVGMMAIDLAGPMFPDRNGMRYFMVAVWIGWHNHKVLSIPFVELVSSRLAIEVYDALTRVVNRLENLVSDVLPSIEHGTNRMHSLRILRLHSDRASEFMGTVAKNWARHHNVHTTFTGAHSPQSNGRAENCIKTVKSMVRRALLSSSLPLEFWGLAARHSGEMLMSHNLRKAGDKKAEQPLPFGSLVAVRRLGKATSFKPFEKRGRLGRILLHETGSRRCFVLDGDNVIWKGFSARPVLDIEMSDGDTVPVEFSDAGWTRIRLVTGRHAWFNPDMGLFRLTPPTLMSDEPFEKVVEEEGLAESACVHAIVGTELSEHSDVCSELERSFPDVLVDHESDSPDVASEHEMARSDTAAWCASDVSPTENEEFN